MPERSKLPTLKTNQALPDFHDHSLACVFNHLHILYGYRLNFCFFEWWKKVEVSQQKKTIKVRKFHDKWLSGFEAIT